MAKIIPYKYAIADDTVIKPCVCDVLTCTCDKSGAAHLMLACKITVKVTFKDNLQPYAKFCSQSMNFYQYIRLAGSLFRSLA
jgi:hypothetical protein